MKKAVETGPQQWAKDIVAEGTVNKLQDGISPLMHACMLLRSCSKAEVESVVETALFLLNNGADARCFAQKETETVGPLTYAQEAGGRSLELMQALISHGAEIDGPPGSGETPLVVAAKLGKLELVKFLVENGANIDTPSTYLWAKEAKNVEETVQKYAGGNLNKDQKAVVQFLKDLRDAREGKPVSEEKTISKQEPKESKARESLSADDLFKSRLSEIEQWLNENRPEYFSMLNKGASKNELQQFEKQLNIKLPELFKILYSWRNGQNEDCFETFFDNRMFMPLDSIASSKQILDGMIGTDFEDPDWWKRDWLPFLHNGGGDHLCIDLSSGGDGTPGQLVEFWHADEDRPIAYASLQEWIDELHESMEDDSYDY